MLKLFRARSLVRLPRYGAVSKSPMVFHVIPFEKAQSGNGVEYSSVFAPFHEAQYSRKCGLRIANLPYAS